MIVTFIKSFVADTEVGPNLIVAFHDPANDATVELASANTDALLGVSDSLGAEAGAMVDVKMGGFVPVKLGGTVQAGQPVTANATGQGIAATAAVATTVRFVGFAVEPGVSGDIIDVFFAPGVIHQG